MKSIQLINTAILKSRSDQIEADLQGKLSRIAESPAMSALDMAISELAINQKITKDQAALDIVSVIKELDHLWTNYLILEGSDKLKNSLKTTD